MVKKNSDLGRRKVLSAITSVLMTVGFGAAGVNNAFAQEELNALVWCDHTDTALLSPFEKKYNVKVNVKEYEGTGAGLSILDQSRPGDWDVFVIDGVDVPRAVKLGHLAEMPADALPTKDFFPDVVMESNNIQDGKIYAVTEKFGYNTISYDKTKVDPEDMKDMSIIWSDKYKGRVAIYDYYLPVIGMVAVGLGKKTAELTKEDMPEIKEKLFAMKAASRLVGDVVSSQTALATGEVDILIGGGEWITAVLSKDKPNLDWVIPEQGAMRWSQSIGIVKSSERKDLAQKFIQYIVSPEGQARLATSSCFWGMPANQEAGKLLTANQKKALRWDNQPEYLKKSQFYPVPDAELNKLMEDTWIDMLQQ